MKKKFFHKLTVVVMSFAITANFAITALAGDIMIDIGGFDEPDYTDSITFPRFDNTVDYSRGLPTSYDEAYPDYKEYSASRHEFSDMISHVSEVSAVKLAEMGVFEKSENFSPNGNMTVMEFMRALLKLCGRSNAAAETDGYIKSIINKSGLIENGVAVDYCATLTNELLAYFLGRAAYDTANSSQYRLLLDDYSDISANLRTSVLDSIAAGITEISNFKLNPKAMAKRSDISDGLYRLYNAAARVIPLFDLGSAYSETTENYLIKSTYEKNQSGVQFGFFSNYNKQADAFLNYGTMPIDRTGFYKWSKIETSKGIYEMPNFNNDKSSHKAGNTIINCIDISANLEWNSLFDESNIPEFYTQDITDSETRVAAKAFLYEFVTQMLSAVGGDVILAIDYEVNWQLAIWNTEAGQKRADYFAKWFAEACQVARQAASDLGKSNNLKLMVIYNNITPKLLAGVSQNQWMLDVAEAADYIGIDTYDSYDDKTDPSYTIQNIRFLMNNYSLDKPVMVVENGLSMLRDFDTIDEVTGLTQIELSEQYYKNLFREFLFALERGDFLNANLEAFLIWSYYDTNDETEKTYGIANDDNTLRDNGIAVKEGIDRLYNQKQFNPSRLSNTAAVAENIPINIKSGIEYDKLTLIVNGNGEDGTAAVNIELNTDALVYVTVNGKEYYTDYLYKTVHSVEIKNLRDGTNVVDIRFGAEKIPCNLTVKKAELVMNSIADWNAVTSVPKNNLLAGKTPYSIVTSKGNPGATSVATGGTTLNMWTNSVLKDNVANLYMHSSKGMTITYNLGDLYGVQNLLLTSGSLSYPRETVWKAYLSDDAATLFSEDNCIAYVKNEAGNSSVSQYVNVNKLKLGRYFGIKLLDNGTDDPNAYISEIGVYQLQGDVNFDGNFDIIDLIHLKKYIAEAIDGLNNKNSADYNSDGKADVVDLIEMRKKLLVS